MNRKEYYALCEILQSLVADQFSNQEQYAHAIHEIFKAFEAQNINFWNGLIWEAEQ